jgi:FtsP/CotA-like multicopper oxidase with cupredoxin domain
MTELLDTTPGAVAAPAAPHWGLTKFADPLPIPPVIKPHFWGHTTVTMRSAEVQLHSQLPPTEVWAYDGHFPGPTFEVRRDRRVRVYWRNEIDTPMPLLGVQALPGTSNEPGFDKTPGNSKPIEGLAELPAWNVVHLHGARTGGGNDGWPANALFKGETQLAEYPNQQAATALWYHDHGMDITRFNISAGLTGMYLIRDEEEDDLGLPHGDHEIPLNICDRNLDTDEDGNLTGQLLYKISAATGGLDADPIPFSGPFTLVNGVIWPHVEVAPRWYRFRLLNSSNSRFFTVDLVDPDGASQTGADQGAVYQIGTDGGLLPKPIPLPQGGLIVAPTERADLLIDFSAFPGKSLRLRNVARNAAPEPDIMEFRVEDRRARDRFTLPDTLSTSYVRLQHGTTLPEDHDHKWVGLVPPGTSGDGHPQLWELAEITDPAQFPPAGKVVEGVIQLVDSEGKTRTFHRVAKSFDETTTFFIDYDRWGIWNFVHLGGPTHPMHIHLTEFQLLTRTSYNTGNFKPAGGGTSAPITPTGDAGHAKFEEGWKDTVQVAAGTMVSVAGQFRSTGNFVYHCHILEHEDEGMMRPFVVMPAQAMVFGHHGGGGHEHPAG